MGRCPLLFAIDCGMDLRVIRRLVEEGGCDPRSSDSFGDTALHYAVNLDSAEIQEWLVTREGQAIKEIKNKDGMKPYDEWLYFTFNIYKLTYKLS